MIIESHVDTPSQLIRYKRNIGLDNPVTQVDFPKLKAGDVSGAFFALYTPPEIKGADATRRALEMLSAAYDACDENPDVAAITFSPEEAEENRSQGLLSVFLGMENAEPIGESLSLLRTFYRLGVSYLTLTHNADNSVADSAAEGTRWGGLSPFGREVVAEMNALGMMIDLSHASDKTFWDCIEASQAPIVATHSCCRALCGHRRNLTDDMLKALGEKGGYVGINFYPYFLSDRFDEAKPWRPGVKEIVDHIDHAVALAGIDHVGIGSDFDGIEDLAPEGLENISKSRLVLDEMRRRGYSETEVLKVAGRNLLEVWGKIITYSK